MLQHHAPAGCLFTRWGVLSGALPFLSLWTTRSCHGCRLLDSPVNLQNMYSLIACYNIILASAIFWRTSRAIEGAVNCFLSLGKTMCLFKYTSIFRGPFVIAAFLDLIETHNKANSVWTFKCPLSVVWSTQIKIRVHWRGKHISLREAE